MTVELMFNLLLVTVGIIAIAISVLIGMFLNKRRLMKEKKEFERLFGTKLKGEDHENI